MRAGRAPTAVHHPLGARPRAWSAGDAAMPAAATAVRVWDHVRVGETGSDFELLEIGTADVVALGDGLGWVPVRRALGIEAFGVNAFRAERAGETVIEDHVESPGQQELYVVLRGRARMLVGGDELDVGAGTAVHVADPEVRRRGTALEDDTIVLAVGGWPGRAYHPLPWEPIYLARPAMQRGDWSAAAEVLLREGGEQLETAILQYRLACCHARLGEDDRALDALRRAIAADPAYGERAATEDAFAGLRDSDGWPA